MECRLEELTKRDVGKHEDAMFWPEHWRAKLCTCGKCRVSGASVGQVGRLPESNPKRVTTSNRVNWRVVAYGAWFVKMRPGV